MFTIAGGKNTNRGTHLGDLTYIQGDNNKVVVKEIGRGRVYWTHADPNRVQVTGCCERNI